MALDMAQRADVERRWQDLEALSGHYTKFEDFLHDMYEDLFPHFDCTELQIDIAQFLQYGPKYRMIQAQRGQAKTTITAAYAVWRLIHDPTTRILIFSAGGDMASEIARWVIQIILYMDSLECMKPETGSQDHVQRSSVAAFDVHWALKGPEKSPSIACMGITANMQGRRADVLIADDIESSKNALTEIQRENLRHLTRDFTSINSKGDIIYLGTPQSIDSIYNELPARGFKVRVWPGRYPTPEEIGNYGDNLAPLVYKKMTDDPSLRTGGGPGANRGKPTDDVLMNEEVLLAKELDQGPAYFQLQHMLDTRMNDELRHPLKSKDCLVMSMDRDNAPGQVSYSATKDNEVWHTNGQGLNARMYRGIVPAGTETFEYVGKLMFIDPAGGGKNGDETGYAITGFLNGYVHVLDVGGVPGGFKDEYFHQLSMIAKKWGVTHIQTERNFGNGAFEQMLRPILKRIYPQCAIEDDVWAAGQKELRIAETMEPIMARHRLIFNEDILRKDVASTQGYPTDVRQTYQLFHQMFKITRDKDALLHDDRLDALAWAVRYWVDWANVDEVDELQKYRDREWSKMMQNPLDRNILESVSENNRTEHNTALSRFGKGRNSNRFIRRR